MDLSTVLHEHLRSDSTGWSMGSFGAIAEFHHDPGECLPPDGSGSLSCITPRGGIRFDRIDDVAPVSYETLSAKRYRWTHGLAFCLPTDRATMSGRAAITEIGPDGGALRAQDRGAILFDIGVSAGGPSQRYIDFCVRTDDAGLIDALRTGCGGSFLDRDNPAMAAIYAKNPHRVALSAIGRVEVYEPIASPASEGKLPLGPHTHVLPKLMASGRLFSANLPIPDDLVPCAMMYPGNPTMSALGADCDFDAELHDSFQQLFWQCGAPEQRDTKRRALLALSNGESPENFQCADSRSARTAVRVLCRQIGRDRRIVIDEGVLQHWLDAFEAASGKDPDDDAA